MNYRPMFDFGPSERKGNAQVFETEAEALGSARDRFRRWTMPTGFGADETADPVTYRWSVLPHPPPGTKAGGFFLNKG